MFYGLMPEIKKDGWMDGLANMLKFALFYCVYANSRHITKSYRGWMTGRIPCLWRHAQNILRNRNNQSCNGTAMIQKQTEK